MTPNDIIRSLKEEPISWKDNDCDRFIERNTPEENYRFYYGDLPYSYSESTEWPGDGGGRYGSGSCGTLSLIFGLRLRFAIWRWKRREG